LYVPESINLSKKGIERYVEKYIEGYLSKLAEPNYTDTFKNGIEIWMVDSAVAYAKQYASDAWIKPGTPLFDSLFRAITTDPDLKNGSLFVDNSSFWHIEGQYRYSVDKLKTDIITGASYRYYRPRSYGTIFSDTLLDPSQKPEKGIDKSLKYRNIDVWEAGGFLQVRINPLQKVKIIGSIRVDKHKNFEAQFSPFAGIVFTHGDHVVRASAQTAFRSPTLQNQYLWLDIGPIMLIGNIDGVPQAYTLNSVKAFRDFYNTTYEVNPDLLKIVSYKPIQPENITTFEVGYRGTPITNLYIDVTAFYNIYKNFIGETRIVIPHVRDSLNTTNAYDAILLGQYIVYQLPVNSSVDVSTYGASLSASYNWKIELLSKNKKATGSISVNYTYLFVDSTELAKDEIIPGFNAPRHKISITLRGDNLWDRAGISVAYIWSDKYMWESPFASGLVPAYSVVNTNIYYYFNEYVKGFIGASNLLNNKHIEVFGGPQIGRIIYGGVRVSLPE